MTSGTIWAHDPTVDFVAAQKWPGTAWAQSGHSLGTKQKAAHWGSFRPILKLLFLIENLWLRGQDLNLRPLGYEPNELPGCSTPRLIRKL